MENDKKVGFTAYEWKRVPIFSDSLEAKMMEDCKMYLFDMNKIYLRPKPPDTRSKLRKIYDEYKTRLSYAWDALRGYYGE